MLPIIVMGKETVKKEKVKKIVYHLQTIYDDGSKGEISEIFDTEEEFVSTHMKFKDLMFSFVNCKKIHLEVQGYEWKQYFDIERI